MVTNGNLLEQKDISDFSNAGLDEFILSMHGVKKESYEDFMDKGDYGKFNAALENINAEKIKNPKLKLRINYTFNQDNFSELKNFFEIYGHLNIDVIQLRPIDKIGETTYNNFSLKNIEDDYLTLVNFMKTESAKRKITLMAPASVSRNEEKTLVVDTQNNSSYLVPFTYCYASPKFYWKEDFNWKEETFNSWKKRKNWNKLLFKNKLVRCRKSTSGNSIILIFLLCLASI